MLSHFSHVWLFATLWTVAHQAPPFIHGILQARMLEWEAMPSSSGSSWPRDRTCVFCVSCIAAGFFHPWATGKPKVSTAAKSLQSCPTLCTPIDGSPPGSLVPGILQARTLEWVAISFSNAWQWKVKVKSLSRVWLLATPWTAAYQAPLSLGFSRQEYWSEVPLPSPKVNTNSTKYKKKLQIVSKFRIHPHQRVLLRNCKSKPHTRRECFQSIYDKILVSRIYGELPEINNNG